MACRGEASTILPHRRAPAGRGVALGLQPIG